MALTTVIGAVTRLVLLEQREAKVGVLRGWNDDEIDARLGVDLAAYFRRVGLIEDCGDCSLRICWTNT